MIFAKNFARNYEKTIIHTWNIRQLVNESFVPATQRTSVLYWRLTDFRSLDSRKEYLGRLWTWLSPSKSWISPSSPSTSLKVEGAQLGKGGTVVCIWNHQTWKKAMQEFIIDWTSLKAKKGRYCGVRMQPLNSNKRDWKGFQSYDVGI